MLTKRVTGLLLAMLLVLSVLFACTPAESGAESSPPAPAESSAEESEEP